MMLCFRENWRPMFEALGSWHRTFLQLTVLLAHMFLCHFYVLSHRYRTSHKDTKLMYLEWETKAISSRPFQCYRSQQ